MADENFSYEQFCSFFPVSRETYQKLETYVALIKKWQESINLISNSTLPTIWSRHIIDSYQLVDMASSGDAPILDIGSGAGLPGIVLAIAGCKVTLVESDGKKIAFLREITRALSLQITLLHKRVEDVSLRETSLITARAFASIATILSMFGNELTLAHRLLLLKGKNYKQEVAEAEKTHAFDLRITQSATDPSGTILLLYNIKPRGITPL